MTQEVKALIKRAQIINEQGLLNRCPICGCKSAVIHNRDSAWLENQETVHATIACIDGDKAVDGLPHCGTAMPAVVSAEALNINLLRWNRRLK